MVQNHKKNTKGMDQIMDEVPSSNRTNIGSWTGKDRVTSMNRLQTTHLFTYWKRILYCPLVSDTLITTLLSRLKYRRRLGPTSS